MRAYLLPAALLIAGSTGLLAGCPGDGKSAIDADGDGFTNAYDCNDADAGIGIAVDYYLDADKDGYGNPQFSASGCLAPEGFVDNPDDCDDLLARYHPTAEEGECGDPNDYNCDGHVDFVDQDKDGFAACEDCDDADGSLNPETPWYRDRDEDGYGNPDAEIHDCNPPTGYVRDGTDCNDFDRLLHEDVKWFNDADEDQYGDPASWVLDCKAPAGHVENSDDCDDADATTNPKREWFEDADEDGYGNPASIGRACVAPSGYVANSDDCDDLSKGTAPGKVELCDNKDNDCDTVIDDGAPTETWYGDNDEDTWGDTRYAVESCFAIPGFVRRQGDCNDGDPGINPAAVDLLCDGVDRACDFEAGLVTWTPTSGAPVDVSDDFATGTIDTPYVWNAPADGELLLCGGTFAAELVIDGFDVDLTGYYGDGATAVAAGLDDHVLFVKNAISTVQGLTFTDGFGSQGGAVHLENSDVILATCSLVDSLADDGGGLWLDATSTATLTGVRIEGNTAADQGGGVWAGGSLITTNGGLLGNDGRFGGGAYVSGTWDATGTAINANSSTTAAVHIATGGLFDATSCDFAPATSPLNNTPHDIFASKTSVSVDLGDDATRLCDDSSCL